MDNGIKTGATLNLQVPSASFYTSRILKHNSKNESDIEKVAQDFESYFVYIMLKEMEKTTNSTNKNFMKQTYMSVVYEKVGDYVARKGVGIKDMIAEHLQKNIKVLKEMGDNKDK